MSNCEIFNFFNLQNWNSGEDIKQYELNGVLNAVEEKMRKHGIKRDNEKTEL